MNNFDRAEQQWLNPPEESKPLGDCYLCEWPVYKDTGDFMSDGLRHFDCKPKEESGD
jgi:hypothetical protein